MKKYLHTLIALCVVIITSSATSQSLQIFDKSENYLPNDTNIYVWGDSSYATVMSVKFNVKNISAASVSFKVKKIIVDTISGSENYFCFGIHCSLSSVYVSPDVATVAPGAMDTTFSGDYRPKGHRGESVITYVFFNIANSDDSAWVVVHFNATPSVINESTLLKAEVSNPYPNPAINYTSFNYSFPENTIHAQFILRNILGYPIKEIEIDNPKGKLLINTTDIKSGIYFYSFFVDDNLILTKKLIVVR